MPPLRRVPRDTQDLHGQDAEVQAARNDERRCLADMRFPRLCQCAAVIPSGAKAMNEEEIDRQIAECRQKALANFPLKLIETTGDKAFAKWAELKLAGQGAPVVLGADDEDHAFGNLLLPFGPEGAEFSRPHTVEDILKDAAAIRFPEDLAAKEKVDRERYLAEFKANLAADPNMPLPTIFESKNGTTRGYSRAETIAAMEAERREPPLGEWPTEPETSLGLSVAYDILTN